jgi:hypothetical protein
MLQDRVVLANNVGTSTTGNVVLGGRYMMEVVATFGGGSVKLQRLGPDDSTFLDIKQVFEKADGTGGTADSLLIGNFTVAGAQILDLAPGSYKCTIATATAVYAALERIPLD